VLDALEFRGAIERRDIDPGARKSKNAWANRRKENAEKVERERNTYIQ